MKKTTFNVALCGIISALSVTAMMFTAIIPVATYALPALAGMIAVVLVIEVNRKWAMASYFVVSVISLLIVSDKEAVAFYILFFGYYPVLKQVIESKTDNHTLQKILKTLAFTVSAVIFYYVTIFVLGVPNEEYEIFGINLPALFLIAGIFIFLLYDFSLTGIITKYVTRYRDKIFKRFK